MTREYKSQYGIGCVVEVVTGLVLDLAVMSLYCQRCAYASTQYGDKDTDAFKAWFETHEPECNQNYHGSSGGMEVSAAEQLWWRSTERGFRMLSDGDARTFNHLSSLRVYGDVELQPRLEAPRHCTAQVGSIIDR